MWSLSPIVSNLLVNYLCKRHNMPDALRSPNCAGLDLRIRQLIGFQKQLLSKRVYGS